MTIHLLEFSNPKGGQKHSQKPKIKPTLKDTFQKNNPKPIKRHYMLIPSFCYPLSF